MRRSFLSLTILCLAAPALAQDLPTVPEGALPPVVLATLPLDLAEEEILDGVRGWQGDLVGDPTPDLLVEAVIGIRGGNAYFFRHFIFIAEGGGYPRMFPIDLGSGLLSVRIEGNELVATAQAYRDGDARCCPSGTEVTRIPLR